MITAQVICELIDAGLSGDLLKAACRRIEAQLPKPVDEAAERRRAYDRERKARKRAEIPPESSGTKTEETAAASTGSPQDSTGSPQMRDIDNNTSLSEVPKKTIPQRASYPPDFSELWELFPRKVGKDEALRAFKRVKGRVGLETLKTAVSKHAALCAGKEKQFIPHPATWLNDGRWQDEELQPPKPLALVSGNKRWVAYGTDQWNAWVAHRKHMGVPPINPNNGGFWFPSEWPPTPAMRRTG